MDLYGLTAGQVIGLFIVGYLVINFIVFAVSGFCRFLAYAFRMLLAKAWYVYQLGLENMEQEGGGEDE